MRAFSVNVNGFDIRAEYSQSTIEGALLPLLSRLCALRAQKGKRVIALLAAPPAAGKSTLALSLAALAKEESLPFCVQALGMDGFHYPNAYLQTHTTRIDGIETPLFARKGCPESFDVQSLKEAVSRLDAPCLWPYYDRTLHDVVPAHTPVTGDILLIEGNWLLLDRPVWRDLSPMADLRVFLFADPACLRDAQIARKMRGGATRAQAEAWQRAVDGPNAELILRCRVPYDVGLLRGREGIAPENAAIT